MILRFGAILSILLEKGGVCEMSKEQSQSKNQTQSTQGQNDRNDQTNKNSKKDQGCQNKR